MATALWWQPATIRSRIMGSNGLCRVSLLHLRQSSRWHAMPNEYFDSHAEMNWQTLPHQMVPESAWPIRRHCSMIYSSCLNLDPIKSWWMVYTVQRALCCIGLKKLGCEVHASTLWGQWWISWAVPPIPHKPRHLDLGYETPCKQKQADIGIAFRWWRVTVWWLIDEQGVHHFTRPLNGLVCTYVFGWYIQQMEDDSWCWNVQIWFEIQYAAFQVVLPKIIRTGSSFLQ